MGKKITKVQEQQLQNLFEKRFKEMFQSGIATGARSVCSVVQDMALNEKKTTEERLNDIVKFCKTGLAEPKVEGKA